ncbi:MAG: L,D-transpeptidase [Solirubrobacterales bacterium]|nr:L,D-transpeptidase [Solirubrobacterales bacterium]
MSSFPRILIAAVLTTVLLALGASQAMAQGPPKPGPGGDAPGAGSDPGSPLQQKPSKTAIRLGGLHHGDLTVGNRIEVRGTLRPYVDNQRVTVVLNRGKQTAKRKTIAVEPKRGNGDVGEFEFSKRLIKPGRYNVEAFHVETGILGGSKATSQRFHIRYPDPGLGDSGDTIKIFNSLLGDLGYVNDEGATYDEATARAVLAFHKVNKQSLTDHASSGMFKTIARGGGGYHLKHPEGGHHVETDLSRQVMVLANGDRVDEIYTISSGKSTTPTILGKFNFYWKQPGTNDHGMVNSVYFLGGYATHGYADVPNYPASHGCLRSPIPDSLHIYNWIDIGDAIYVYH